MAPDPSKSLHLWSSVFKKLIPLTQICACNLLRFHIIPNERYILSDKPCESPVHILAAIMIIVGDTKSIGYIGRNGTASVNKDQTIPAIPKMNSPPYLSLKYPPTTCAGMYPQKNADMIAPWNKQKQSVNIFSLTPIGNIMTFLQTKKQCNNSNKP